VLFRNFNMPPASPPRAATRLHHVRSAAPCLFERIAEAELVYCGHATGLIGWVREAGSRTEACWCPIKQAQRMAEPHLRYLDLADFGDETTYQERVEAFRPALRKGRQVKWRYYGSAREQSPLFDALATSRHTARAASPC